MSFERVPAGPPTIANLQHRKAPLVMPVQAADGRRLGNLPIAFDYADPAGHLDHFLVTLPDHAARKPMDAAVCDRRTGTAQLVQAVVLPPPGEQVHFTVQAIGRDGSRSNVLAGCFVSP